MHVHDGWCDNKQFDSTILLLRPPTERSFNEKQTIKQMKKEILVHLPKNKKK